MGIIYFKHFNNKINKFIKDRKYKNKINEYIEFILSNNGDITLKKDTIILNCKNDNQIYNLKITKRKNNIEYIYSKEKYQEKSQFYKIDNNYITRYIIVNNEKKYNEEITETSTFNKKEQEILKITRKNKKNENKLVIEQEENIYIRTRDNNVILIEKNDNKILYYIGINEDKYEIYIPRHIIYNEIEESEYIELLNNKIKEEDLLIKYFLFQKK